MTWNEMSPADQRRWALEQVRFGEILGLGRTSIDIFAEANALLAYVNQGSSSPLPGVALQAPLEEVETPAPQLSEAA